MIQDDDLNTLPQEMKQWFKENLSICGSLRQAVRILRETCADMNARASDVLVLDAHVYPSELESYTERLRNVAKLLEKQEQLLSSMSRL